MATPWKINIEPEHDVFFLEDDFPLQLGYF